eukprot:1179744-Prorocentrum_minimum.AAC.3
MTPVHPQEKNTRRSYPLHMKFDERVRKKQGNTLTSSSSQLGSRALPNEVLPTLKCTDTFCARWQREVSSIRQLRYSANKKHLGITLQYAIQIAVHAIAARCESRFQVRRTDASAASQYDLPQSMTMNVFTCASHVKHTHPRSSGTASSRPPRGAHGVRISHAQVLLSTCCAQDSKEKSNFPVND